MSTTLDLPKWVLPYSAMAVLVGSRATCNPPPTDTDCDVLLFIASIGWGQFKAAAVENGFKLDGSAIFDNQVPEDNQFKSLSNGYFNFIVTTDLIFYEKFLAATSVAKRLNLLEKDDRIALFQAVLYGNRCES